MDLELIATTDECRVREPGPRSNDHGSGAKVSYMLHLGHAAILLATWMMLGSCNLFRVGGSIPGGLLHPLDGCLTPRPTDKCNQSVRSWREMLASSTTEDTRAYRMPYLAAATRGPENGRFRLLRFSPDGRYIVAVDDSGASLLDTTPFAQRLWIRAANIRSSGFSQDSSELWLLCDPTYIRGHRIQLLPRPAPHIERWNIATGQKRASVNLPVRNCGSDGVSPDGELYVCVDHDGTLFASKVATGEILLSKRRFAKQDFAYVDGDSLNTVDIGDLGSASIGFSPDSQFFIASPILARGGIVAWDARRRITIPLKGALRGRPGWFAFLTPNRVLITNWISERKPVSAK
jgi:hypothetical protein